MDDILAKRSACNRVLESPAYNPSRNPNLIWTFDRKFPTGCYLVILRNWYSWHEK